MPTFFDQLETLKLSLTTVRGGTVSTILDQRGIKYIPVRTSRIGFTMMIGQRIDVLLVNGIDLTHLKLLTETTNPVYNSRSLFKIDIYPLLKKSHSHLLPVIESRLESWITRAGGPITPDTIETWAQITIAPSQ